MRPKPGLVSLVGGGPGDPGLCTLRGLSALRAADAVLYDALAPSELLSELPEGAQKVYVGKRRKKHAATQQRIERTMIRLASQGLRVVRLKGGDPFVFGRGGEEIRALARAGVPFEVIPGVTSAIAAPAMAGIPMTHRGVSSTFAIATGTRTGGHAALGKLAGAVDTLVVLMPVARLASIVRQLRRRLDAPTPCALVGSGGLPAQRVLVSTLGRLVRDAKRAPVPAPAVLVVGRAVALRDALSWFEKRGLFGKRVVVTRAADDAGPLAEALADGGAHVIRLPTIARKPPRTFAELDRALRSLRTFGWVVFASAATVDVFFTRLGRQGRDARSLAGARVASVGAETSRALERHGVRPDLVAPAGNAESLASALGPRARGARVLLPRAQEGREVLPDRLRAAGARVVTATAYRTATAARPGAATLREAESADAVTFTSPSTVRGFVAILGRARALRVLRRCTVAAIGATTAAALDAIGIPAVVATEPSVHGLVAALEARLDRRGDGS